MTLGQARNILFIVLAVITAPILYGIGYLHGERDGYDYGREMWAEPLHPAMTARGWRAESTRDTPRLEALCRQPDGTIVERVECESPAAIRYYDVPRPWAYCDRVMSDEEVERMEERSP